MPTLTELLNAKRKADADLQKAVENIELFIIKHLPEEFQPAKSVRFQSSQDAATKDFWVDFEKEGIDSAKGRIEIAKDGTDKYTLYLNKSQNKELLVLTLEPENGGFKYSDCLEYEGVLPTIMNLLKK